MYISFYVYKTKQLPHIPIFSYLSFTKSSKPIICQKLSSQPPSEVYVHLHTTVQRDLEKRRYRHRIGKMKTFGFKFVTTKKFVQNYLFIYWSTTVSLI